MPKQTELVNQFIGGLNTTEARDLADNQLSELWGWGVSDRMLMTQGMSYVTTTDVRDPYPPDLENSNIQPGWNLFAFSADTHYSGKDNFANDVIGEEWVAYQDATGSNDVHIFGRYSGHSGTITAISAAADAVITSSGHSLAVGDYVSFHDIAGTIGTDVLNDTIHRVKAVADVDNFSIDQSTSGKAYTSGGKFRGGQPGQILAADEPRPAAGGSNTRLVYFFVDGALRMSNSHFGYTDHVNKWWGYIKRTLFSNIDTSDKVLGNYYPVDMAINKPGATSTFKDSETFPSNSATYTYDPALNTDDETHFVSEDTMDAGGLNNAPTIEKITITAQITADVGDVWQYDITIGESHDTGSSFYGTDYNTFPVTGRGTTTKTLVWTGSWAISGGSADGIMSKLEHIITTASSDIDVTSIKLEETSNSWTDHALTGEQVHVGIKSASLTGATGWDNDWELGVSFLYDESNKQESLIQQLNNETVTGNTYISPSAGHAPDLVLFIDYDNDDGTAANNWNVRIVGAKLYMREISGGESSDKSEWYPQVTYDFIEGTATAYESGHIITGEYDSTSTQHIFQMPSTYLKRPHKRSTYEIETGVPEDERSLMVQYKAAVVTNRRTYVGNLLVPQEDGTKKVMGDTMIKSPVNSFDILPMSNSIDVAVRDGDDITALHEWNNRLLQFKKKSLYIINIARDVEILEGKYDGKGLFHPHAAVRTDFGIAWVNKQSAWLYNGSRIIDMLSGRNGERLISQSVWSNIVHEGYNTPTSVGYSAKYKCFIVDPNADETALNHAYVYDFNTSSWSGHPDSIPDASSHGRTNWVQRWDGEAMYMDYNGVFHYFRNDFASVAGSENWFTTKDFIFNSLERKKKIYEVHMTYKATVTQTDAVERLTYSINGTNDLKYFSTLEVEGSVSSTLTNTFVTLRTINDAANCLVGNNPSLITATRITITSTDNLKLGDYIKIEDEIMRVSNKQSGTVIDVERALLGTSAAEHALNTAISVLTWKRATFKLSTPVTCQSMKFNFKPNVTAGLMINDFHIVNRPVMKRVA